MVRFTFLLFACLSGCFTLFAQDMLVYGEVSVSVSGERVSGATVSIPDLGVGTITDAYGRYSLRIPGGRYTLRFSYVGLNDLDTTLTLTNDLNLDISLESVTLDELVVKADTRYLKPNTVHIPIERLKAIPMLLGQPDVIKALAYIPGVLTGTEGTTGLYVRGGSPDQNLILLDGATVYNTAHLFGFQSVFDPEAIKDIQFIKGGFPARYGGRLSSIVDIAMKEGNEKEHKGTFTLGAINSGIMLEGPVQKEQSSYMVSGRAAYLGLLALPTAIGWKEKENKVFNTMLSYDVNAKVNHEFANKDRLFASVYVGHDNTLTRYREDSTLFGTDLGWGNTTGSLRYLHAFGKALYGTTMLHATQYEAGEENSSERNSAISSYLNQSSVKDIGIKQQFAWQASPSVSLHWGLEGLRQRFVPTRVVLEDNSSANLKLTQDSLAKITETYTSNSLSLFAETQWTVFDWLQINPGLRLTTYGASKSYTYAEPRFQGNATWGKSQVYIAYAFTSQFLHLLANNTLGLSSDLWVPSTALVAPQTAHQYGVGYQYLGDKLEWGLDAYYKQLFQQIDYQEGSNFFANNDLNWERIIEKNGEGRAYGLEAMVKYHANTWSGWLSYTLSWNDRRFENINNGNWYPFKYDRRNNLAITLNKHLSKKWQMGTNFQYSTGHWVTFSSNHYLANAKSGSDFSHLFGEHPYYNSLIYPQRNNQRVPAYHRADVSFSRHSVSKKKGNDVLWVFGVYNVYARKNPFQLRDESRVSGGSEPGTPQDEIPFQKKVIGRALFSFIPSVSYKYSW